MKKSVLCKECKQTRKQIFNGVWNETKEDNETMSGLTSILGKGIMFGKCCSTSLKGGCQPGEQCDFNLEAQQRNFDK